MAESKGLSKKTKKDSNYQKVKDENHPRLERAAPAFAYAGAAVLTGMASYPHSESNPIYIKLGIPGHEAMENFFNGTLHNLNILDPSVNINLPEITPYITGALFYAGYRRAKDISEKRLKTYEKIESAIGEGILKEIQSGSSVITT